MKSYSDDIQNDTAKKAKVTFWWQVANSVGVLGLAIAYIVAYYVHHAA